MVDKDLSVSVIEFQRFFPEINLKLKKEQERMYDMAILYAYSAECKNGFIIKKIYKTSKKGTAITYKSVRDKDEMEKYHDLVREKLKEFSEKWDIEDGGKTMNKDNKKTIAQATREWVREFNAIPTDLIERAFKNDIDYLTEHTMLVTSGDEVEYKDFNFEVLEMTNRDTMVLKLTDKVSNFSQLDEDDLCETIKDIDDVSIGDKVYYTPDNEDTDFDEVEVYEIDNASNEITIVIRDVDVQDLDNCPERDSWLPCWGTMWSFGEGLDSRWALDNIETVSSIGFRVFEDEHTGDVYIGLDGGGYDFYEQHWIPLYKARGLKWHNIEE